MNKTSALVFAVLMAGTNAIGLQNLEGECLCEDNTKSSKCCPATCAPTCGAEHEGKAIPDVKKVEKKVEKKVAKKEAKAKVVAKKEVAKVVHHAEVKKAAVVEKEADDKTKAVEAHK